MGMTTTKKRAPHLVQRLKYVKRKRGLIKKAMEMNRMCNQKVFLVLHDPETDHLAIYNSNLETLTPAKIAESQRECE